MIGFRDDDDLNRASEVLAAAGYTEARIKATLGLPQLLLLHASDIPPGLRRTRALSAHDTLVRLFMLGAAVPEKAARDALAPMAMEKWVAAELLSRPTADGEVLPRARLTPVEGMLLAADVPRIQTAEAPGDFVMSPGHSSLQLANAMIRRRSRRTLDLGTGCGILALLAEPHSDRVIATDKNERALAFTRFNARLNRVGTVECLHGDLFQPVSDQRFDLVLSNPPFVISPSRRYLFRDSGIRGDAFCRQLVRSVPPLLEEGGFCQITSNVAHVSGRSWQDDLSGWFEGCGCEAVAWPTATEEISAYAMNWILATESHDEREVPRLYDSWMDYFERERIEAVSHVILAMRRSQSAASWTQICEAPRRIVGPCGEALLRSFEMHDLFRGAEADEILLGQRLRLAADLRIQQRHEMAEGGLELKETQLLRTGALRYATRLDAHVVGLLARCTGSRSLGDLLSEMAESLGADPEPVLRSGLSIARELVESGVLLPEDPRD